ncbi:26S proteasome non-ATPase regulatory subunit 12 [Gaertneriomyces sp. JEL0708]|nr:26S proteasome non-ATPase regulatory subunit 12 [Gaertneriomyces sp. JEL0708]
MDNNEKPKADLSELAASQIPEAEQLAQQGKTDEAFEKLLSLEKQSRVAADLSSNTKALSAIVRICCQLGLWAQLNDYVTLLSKKHGLLKQAVTDMIKQAVECIDKTPDSATKMELLNTLRTVTAGKIFVEVERARVSRILASIKESEGNIAEAFDILQELQVETFGSMEKREKTDFILEQMRLALAKSDFSRAQIISRKINTRFFKETENQDLKLRYYNLMIQYAVHENQYLQVCKYFRQIFDTPTVQEKEEQWTEVLQNIVYFIILSPYDNEQSDLIHRVYEEPKLAKIGIYKDFLKCFITNELMRWPKIEEIYGHLWKANQFFDDKSEEGKKHCQDLHRRVIEHNIRVIGGYYSRVTVKRLTQLLDLSSEEAERFLSDLVVNKTVQARIDRPAGIVSFKQKANPNTVLNEWSTNINSLLDLIVKTTHLITKEEMVNNSGLAKAV